MGKLPDGRVEAKGDRSCLGKGVASEEEGDQITGDGKGTLVRRKNVDEAFFR